jgi:hypothetical protein
MVDKSARRTANDAALREDRESLAVVVEVLELDVPQSALASDRRRVLVTSPFSAEPSSSPLMLAAVLEERVGDAAREGLEPRHETDDKALEAWS